VDDERSMRELLSIVLRREQYEVLLAENGAAAIAILEREPVDLLISDIKMPDMSGVDVLRAAKRIDADMVGIMITAFASTETAVEALRLGAYDYISKPFDVEALKAKVRNAIERRVLRQENVLLKRALRTSATFSNIVGKSRVMQVLFDLIETVAPTNSTILVNGESGTGKELVARAIHVNSLRRDHPFVALNCGALPETLLESELFGHTRGAFTGAATTKKGLIEAADRGTVFLDEISEMSPLMQVKLLRVLQERKFRRLGGTDEIDADIRIIAATNRDLLRMIGEGRFREDLYYRINVIPILLPPLRERREDIPLLAEHFLRRFREQMDKRLEGLSAEAVHCLEDFNWPGNVRQLENVIERAVALERTTVIQAESLPLEVCQKRDTVPSPNDDAGRTSLPESGLDLPKHLESQEREFVAQALRQAGGRHDRAARLLGISPRQFRYLLDKHELR
jgi:two-component system response regulator PilR (NtrC family)